MPNYTCNAGKNIKTAFTLPAFFPHYTTEDLSFRLVGQHCSRKLVVP